MSVDIRQMIIDAANKAGIPFIIPLTIAQHESSLNPQAQGDNTGSAKKPVYTSFGLFQLHRGGLVPANMSNEQLLNPATNISIALPAMLQSYKQGLFQGLSNFDLVQYVANNSGWPNKAGVDSVNQNTNYNSGLLDAYNTVTGGQFTFKLGKPPTNPYPTSPTTIPGLVDKGVQAVGDIGSTLSNIGSTIETIGKDIGYGLTIALGAVLVIVGFILMRWSEQDTQAVTTAIKAGAE